MVLSGGGKSDMNAFLGDEKYIHKICTGFSFLLVIFVLSAPKLGGVRWENLISFVLREKTLKTVE